VLKADETVTVHPVKLGTADVEKFAVQGLKAGELIVIDGKDCNAMWRIVKRATKDFILPVQDYNGVKFRHGK